MSPYDRSTTLVGISANWRLRNPAIRYGARYVFWYQLLSLVVVCYHRPATMNCSTHFTFKNTKKKLLCTHSTATIWIGYSAVKSGVSIRYLRICLKIFFKLFVSMYTFSTCQTFIFGASHAGFTLNQYGATVMKLVRISSTHMNDTFEHWPLPFQLEFDLTLIFKTNKK